MIDITKCSDEELKTMLGEAREPSKHSWKLGRVMGIVAAHRLKEIRELLAYQELATWRRMNGFDRVADGEDNWFHSHRSLPPTPEKFAADLWCEVNALKDTISMPRQKASNLINAIEQGKISDEELAILRRLVEKRDHVAVQVTVTHTVQHSSPYPIDPKPSPSVYAKVGNAEGKMGPELEELKSPLTGTGLETPVQQGPPNEGTWEQRRNTANGFLTMAVDSSQGGRIPPTTECVDMRASENSTRITEDTTFLKQGHKTFSEQNKQFDPGWRAVRLLVCGSCVFLSLPCVCLFSQIIDLAR